MADTNWLGLSSDFSFDTVEDKQSSSSNEAVGLLKCGDYKATITEVNLVKEGTPKLVITFEEETTLKTIKADYWLTKLNDKDSANIKNLRNLISRALYSDLTETEYRAIDTKEVADRCNKVLLAIAQNKSFEKAFIGKKVLISLTQNPFFSKDKDTKEIKFSNVKRADLPTQLQNIITDYENYNNCTLDKVPQFAFSNKVKMYGVHFYNDFREDAKYFDTKAYEFVQGLKNNNVATTNNVVDDIEEIAF